MAKFKYCLVTHPGMKKAINEDALIVGSLVHQGLYSVLRSRDHDTDDQMLFAVADGLGRHGKGDVASKLLLERLRDQLRSVKIHHEEMLRDLLQDMNRYLFGVFSQISSIRPIGATCAGLLFCPGSTAYAFNVGDSRAYLFRDRLIRLTDDHRGATRGSVTQCFGGTSVLEPIFPHVIGVEVCAGDRFLLCTDGVTDFVEDTALEQYLRHEQQSSVGLLLQATLQAKAPDNFTLIDLRIDSGC